MPLLWTELPGVFSQILDVSDENSAVNEPVPLPQQGEFEMLFCERGKPWGDNQELKDVYRKNFHLVIRDSNPRNRRSHTYRVL